MAAPLLEVSDLRVEIPSSRGVVEAVDGVSLTVVEAGRDAFTVSLIPTTLGLTTLGLTAIGDAVNLEVDVVAKYVERLLQWRTP